MKNLFISTIFFACITINAQLNIEWQHSYGGSWSDYAYCVQHTSDGGFIVGGLSYSDDGDIHGNTEGHGAVLIRFDSNNDTVWLRFYDGWPAIYGVCQSSDNGYITIGKEYSIMKVNENGDTLWTKDFGEESFLDKGYSIIRTNDNCYITAGSLWRNGEGLGLENWYLVKMNSDGDTLWTKLYNYVAGQAHSIDITVDGGFIVAGSKDLNALEEGSWTPDNNFYIMKLNSNGDTIWTKSYGGEHGDEANSIKQTSDGGYIVAGFRNFPDSYDYWILKLNETGEIEWQKTLNSYMDDMFYSVVESPDGGFIFAGYNYPDESLSGIHCNDHWQKEYWVVKYNSDGTSVEWCDCFGGEKDDVAMAIDQINNGDYIVAGYTNSDDGDVSVNHGDSDIWLIKLKDGSTYINNPQSAEFVKSIYYSPVFKELTLQLHQQYPEIKVTIVNSVGQLISTSDYYNTDYINKDISEFSDGLFIVNIKCGNKIYRKKILK